MDESFFQFFAVGTNMTCSVFWKLCFRLSCELVSILKINSFFGCLVNLCSTPENQLFFSGVLVNLCSTSENQLFFGCLVNLHSTSQNQLFFWESPCDDSIFPFDPAAADY